MPEREQKPANQEVRKNYPYSSIVVMTYTSRIEGIAGKRIIPKRTADLRLSAYSGMVTVASRMLYEAGKAPNIVIYGESTFGGDLPSTPELMKRTLIARDVPEDTVKIKGNLQDTNEQIQELKNLKETNPELMRNPLIVLMKFHKNRVDTLLTENQIQNTTLQPAEGIIFDYQVQQLSRLKDEDPVKFLDEVEKRRKKLKKFTTKKIQLAEFAFRTANNVGPFREKALKLLRKTRKGQTITDRLNFTSAEKHLRQAQRAIRAGKLRPGDITA